MAAYDLVIRGGSVADGTGGEIIDADVAVKDGKIAAVGKITGAGAEEIAAKGKLVTPGFVDVHTHYDAQVTWGNRLTPSTDHGVTSVLMGNCAVGFAPCRPDQRDAMIEVMEGVEDIPGIVMKEGVPFEWTTFPEYLDFLDRHAYDADIAAQVPHAAVRVYVMGKRAIDREPATTPDIAEMTRIVREGVEAGALGFSTSHSTNHRLKDGRLAPTVTAAEEEVRNIALGLKAAGKGVIQLTDSFYDVRRSFEVWRRVVEESRRPLSLAVVQSSGKVAKDDWRIILELLEEARRAGLPMTGQVCMRPIGMLLGLTGSIHAFSACASYRAIAHLPLEQKVAQMRQPELRKRLLSEKLEVEDRWQQRQRGFDNTFRLGDPPNYAPAPEMSLSAEARRRGVPALELAYDGLLERDGRELFLYPTANYKEQNLNAVHEMMVHPHTVIGIADGGAHVNMLCDAGAPTYLLTHWTRDTTDNKRVSVSWAVQALTQKPAQMVGFNDRGVIAPGYKADLNVIDYDGLRLHAPYSVNDLPKGGSRFVQKADGYIATILSGAVTYRNGVHTGALPGKLVRGAQAAPAAGLRH